LLYGFVLWLIIKRGAMGNTNNSTFESWKRRESTHNFAIYGFWTSW